MSERKESIQNRFREETGLLIDVVLQGKHLSDYILNSKQLVINIK